MSLTPTEEAQTRDLIAQQSALLSLAGVESTILSKLGATKKNIGQQPVATALNDVDIMFVRQGTDDKGVSVATVKAATATVVNDATETVKGIVELATDAETQTGTDTVRAITPSNLTARTATETRTGIVEKATTAEAQAFTADKYIDGERLGQVVLGANQTLQNLTGSRLLSTTYTNSTGKPIFVNVISSILAVGASLNITVNGIQMFGTSYSVINTLHGSSCFAIVPPGGTYSAACSTGGNGTLISWAELR